MANIYEVKTSNWTISGTAGEKVLGTMYKYSDIPKFYKKPLKIICIAYQEYELTNCNTKIFGKISEILKIKECKYKNVLRNFAELLNAERCKSV